MNRLYSCEKYFISHLLHPSEQAVYIIRANSSIYLISATLRISAVVVSASRLIKNGANRRVRRWIYCTRMRMPVVQSQSMSPINLRMVVTVPGVRPLFAPLPVSIACPRIYQRFKGRFWPKADLLRCRFGPVVAKVVRPSDPLRKENLAGARDGNFKRANAPLEARASHRSARYICIKFERAVNRTKRDDIARLQWTDDSEKQREIEYVPPLAEWSEEMFDFPFSLNSLQH